MSWSIVYNEQKGEWVITHAYSIGEIRIPQMREADAMHIVMTLEQAKARFATKR